MSTAQTVGETKVWVNKVLYMVPDPVADELDRRDTQIDALQQKVHLCAAYDVLETENKRLRVALVSIAGDTDDYISPGIRAFAQEALSEIDR